QKKPELTDEQWKSAYAKGLRRLHRNIRPHSLRTYTMGRLTAAAMLLLTLTFGIYYLVLNPDDRSGKNRVILHTADLAPGSDRAALKLPDGRIIDLDAKQNGIVISEE